MYLPVTFIILVLFAFAGSSSTSNEAGEPSVDKPNNVPDKVTVNVSSTNKESSKQKPAIVDKRSKINTITAKNKTLISTNNSKKSSLDLAAVPKAVKRPKDLNNCTQTLGVRATCLLIGKRSKSDRRVVKRVIMKYGKVNVEQLSEFSYSVTRRWLKKGYVISYIKVTNRKKVGKEGLVALVRGGVLDNEVVLQLESQTGRTMHFQIEIYIGPVAKVYKERLHSIASRFE